MNRLVHTATWLSWDMLGECAKPPQCVTGYSRHANRCAWSWDLAGTLMCWPAPPHEDTGVWEVHKHACPPCCVCDSIEREQAHKQACPQCLVVALAHHGYVNNHTHATRGQRLAMKGMPKVYPCHYMVPLRHMGHVNGGVLDSTGVPGTGSACKQV